MKYLVRVELIREFDGLDATLSGLQELAEGGVTPDCMRIAVGGRSLPGDAFCVFLTESIASGVDPEAVFESTPAARTGCWN